MLLPSPASPLNGLLNLVCPYILQSSETGSMQHHCDTPTASRHHFPWHLVTTGSVEVAFARALAFIMPKEIARKLAKLAINKYMKKKITIKCAKRLKFLDFFASYKKLDINNILVECGKWMGDVDKEFFCKGERILILIHKNTDCKMLDRYIKSECNIYLLPLSGKLEDVNHLSGRKNIKIISEYADNILNDERDYRIARKSAKSICAIIDKITNIDTIKRISTPMENLLTIEIGGYIRIANYIMEISKKLNAKKMLILDGENLSSIISPYLEKFGFFDDIRSVCASRFLVDHIVHMQQSDSPALPDMSVKSNNSTIKKSEILSAFISAVDVLSRKYAPNNIKKLKGMLAICADFRSGKDFRYLPTAHRVINMLKERNYNISIMQPYGIMSMKSAALYAGNKIRSGEGNIIFVKTPKSHGAMMESFNLSLSMEEEIREEISQKLGPGIKYVDIIINVAVQFIAHQLHSLISTYNILEHAFREYPPAVMAFFPGSMPLAMVASAAATHSGIPSLCVFTLLVGNSSRDCIPTCSHLAVMDTWQRELLARRWNYPPDRIFLVGNETLRKIREEIRKSKDGAGFSGRKRVVFVSQPVGKGSLEAVKWCIQALVDRPDTEFVVYAHPNESVYMITRYQELLQNTGNPLFRFGGCGTPLRELAIADVVITLTSNLGMHAAAAGKPLITLPLFGRKLTVDFHRMGLAEQASSPAELQMLLEDFLSGGERLQALQAKQEAYRRQNPEMAHGDVAELLASALETLAQESLCEA